MSEVRGLEQLEGPGARETVESVWESEQEAAVQAPLDPISEWLGKFIRARELEAQAKAHKEEAREMLVSYLEERGAEYGTIGNKLRLRWRAITTNRFDVKKFRAAHPELAEQFTRQAVERRMEVIDND